MNNNKLKVYRIKCSGCNNTMLLFRDDIKTPKKGLLCLECEMKLRVDTVCVRNIKGKSETVLFNMGIGSSDTPITRFE